jgi:sugar/nucleoside kinase (ribokinase family)
VRGLAVLGNLSLDRIDGGPPTPGGGPFHCARMLRAIGRPAVVLAGCAAADRERLLPALARLGIPVVWHETPTTARFAIDYEGDARRMAVEELGGAWAPDIAGNDALAGTAWLHVAPLARSDFPPETLAALARGRRLSLDGQGLVRPSRTGPLELDPGLDPELLQHVSILKLAEEEALALLGETSEQALRTLDVPEVVVTLGPRGSIVLADGLAEHVPTRPVLDRDPTGAGDAFAVAYLLARSAGSEPPAAARWASSAVAGLLSGSLR